MHWWPKIQVSGTGLALVSGLAPTLGIPVPYWLRAVGFVVGLCMLGYPIVAWLIAVFSSHRRHKTGIQTHPIDWSIRDLFAYLGPTLPLKAITGKHGVSGTDNDRWESIGNEVIKQLSLGRVRATPRDGPRVQEYNDAIASRSYSTRILANCKIHLLVFRQRRRRYFRRKE